MRKVKKKLEMFQKLRVSVVMDYARIHSDIVVDYAIRCPSSQRLHGHDNDCSDIYAKFGMPLTVFKGTHQQKKGLGCFDISSSNI